MGGRVIRFILKGDKGMKGNDEAAARQRSRAGREQQMVLNMGNKQRKGPIGARGAALFAIGISRNKVLTVTN